MIKLTDSSLWKEPGFVAGAWTAADSGLTTEIRNPATGAVLGTVPVMGAAESLHVLHALVAALASDRLGHVVDVGARH